MPTPPLDAAKRSEVLRLKSKGYSHSQIAEMADVSVGSVSNVVNGKVAKEEVDRIDQYAGYHAEKFSELKDRFDKWIGDTSRAPKVKAVSKKSRKKILVASDIHAPFHNELAVAQMVRDNPDAQELWIPGDLLDLFSFSRYEKFATPFSPVEEFQSGVVLLRAFSEHFPVVRVMHGNHDERFVRWLVREKQIPPSILEFFKLQDPLFLSPLAKICSKFKNVEMMEPKRLDYAKFPFIHQIGDCVLAHAEKFSRVPNRAVGEIIHWLKSYCEPQGIVTPFRIAIQAHTHQAGKTYCDYGVVGMENGCMSKVPDYAGDPKIRGAQRPSIIGYTVLYQDNGITDLNNSNFREVEL